MEVVYIYGLFDPNSRELRYVGQTINLRTRFKAHISPSQIRTASRKNNWIKSLLSKGLVPEIDVLEVTSSAHATELEAFYIAYFRSIGCRLTNMAEAGWHYRGPRTGRKALGQPATGKNLRGLARPSQFVPVNRINIATGLIEKTYPSTRFVSEDGFNASSVSSVCIGRNVTHRGFHWRYASEKGAPRPARRKSALPTRRKVQGICAINLTTQKELKFRSAYLAAIGIGVHPSCRSYVHDVCRGLRPSYKGFTFKYAS